MDVHKLEEEWKDFIKTLHFANEENRPEMLQCMKVLFRIGWSIGKYLTTCSEKLTHVEALRMVMDATGMQIVEDEEGHTAIYQDGKQI